MPELVLYAAPGTCARVPTIALEEAGVPFEIRLIAFMAGEHRSPAYLAQNPKGKVPTLLIDGQPLTENVAILIWLSGAFPEARLLPDPGDFLGRVRILSDLAFCASTLHPIVTRLRLPQRFCDLDGGPKRVWDLAAAAMAPNFALVDARLAEGWWYGREWSVMDAYLYWVWFRVTGAGFDASAYPSYARHAARMEERPSVQRALAREAAQQAELEARGLALKFPPR